MSGRVTASISLCSVFGSLIVYLLDFKEALIWGMWRMSKKMDVALPRTSMPYFEYSVWVFSKRVLWKRKLEKNLDESKLP